MKTLALITGGTGDIGTAIIKQLHPYYDAVIALDVVQEAKGEQWLAALQEQGYERAHYQHLDVTDYEQCAVVTAHLRQQWGCIDTLINNAGITRDAVFPKMTKKQWDDVLGVNLNGIFNITKQVIPIMVEKNAGRIITISSVNAQKGQFSQVNYASSKAGIYGFTKSLAQEMMRYGITVNSISPGYVNTHLMNKIRPDILQGIIDLIPAKRLAEPEEIAWTVEFLQDERSAYITGANLSINGGLHMY